MILQLDFPDRAPRTIVASRNGSWGRKGVALAPVRGVRSGVVGEVGDGSALGACCGGRQC